MADNHETTIVVYVLHHPDSEEGKRLAQELYTYFRRPSPEVFRSRIGLPVYVRSESFRNLDELGLPAKTEETLTSGDLRLRPFGNKKNDARLTFVIPLIDATMVADERWRDLVAEFVSKVGARQIKPEEEAKPKKRIHVEAGKAGGPAQTAVEDRVRIIPVSLHNSAEHLHPQLAVVQGVSAFRWTDDDLPSELRPQTRASRVKRELALAMIRTIRWCITGKPELEPVKIFLSHAKKDREYGPGVAEKLRDTISTMGHLRAWYDETDLLPGSQWMEQLRSSGPASDGMIVCLSDNYAERPWCRAELRSARKPWKIKDLGAKEVWTNCPVVVVDLLGAHGHGRWTQTIGELGDVPVVRWDAQRAEEIVDRMIRESLMSVANAYHGSNIVEAASPGSNIIKPAEIAVTWSPDATTISEVIADRSVPGDPDAGKPSSVTILHPGYGHTYLPKHLGTFRAFDEVNNEPPSSHPKKVQLSLSDGGSDLARLGMFREHISELAFDLATGVLAAGHDLIYGGTPQDRAGQRDGVDLVAEVLNAARVANDSAAERLRNAARGVNGSAAAKQRNTTAALRVERLERLTLLEPWRGRVLTAAEKVANLPFAKVEQVLPPKPPEDLREDAEWLRFVAADRDNLPVYLAKALSEMRRKAAERADLVVIAGGKDAGFGGYLPGVLEELMCAVEASPRNGKAPPVLVLGGFGGAARHIARRIAAWVSQPGHEQPLDSWWTPSWHREQSPHQFGELWRLAEARGESTELERLWERAGKAVDQLAVRYRADELWLLRNESTRKLRGVLGWLLKGKELNTFGR